MYSYFFTRSESFSFAKIKQLFPNLNLQKGNIRFQKLISNKKNTGVGGTAILKVLLPESAIPYYAIVRKRYCRKPLLCSLRYYPIVLLWIRWGQNHMHFKHAMLFLLNLQILSLELCWAEQPHNENYFRKEK